MARSGQCQNLFVIVLPFVIGYGSRNGVKASQMPRLSQSSIGAPWIDTQTDSISSGIKSTALLSSGIIPVLLGKNPWHESKVRASTGFLDCSRMVKLRFIAFISLFLAILLLDERAMIRKGFGQRIGELLQVMRSRCKM
jgi:hypothetical protein